MITTGGRQSHEPPKYVWVLRDTLGARIGRTYLDYCDHTKPKLTAFYTVSQKKRHQFYRAMRRRAR